MNQNNKEKITVSQETEFNAPAVLPFHWVDKFDWERLKYYVKKIETKASKLENFAWFMVAASLGFFVAAFQGSNEGFFWTAFGFSVVVTIIVYIFSKVLSKKDREAKNDALHEMDIIEIKSRMVSSKDIVINSSKLEIVEALYGKGNIWTNVTDELVKSSNNNILIIKASNDIKVDPLPGTVKELRVKYRIDGVDFDKVVNEGETLMLP